MSCENTVLLLSGSQHYDEKRPVTGKIHRFAESVDPLGIAIVAAYARRYGLEVKWMEMEPGQSAKIEAAMEGVKGVFISSRFFDSSLAQEAIDTAHNRGIKSVVGGYAVFNGGVFNTADTRVKGEVEPVTDRLFDDFRSGRLQSLYDSTKLPPYDITGSYVWPDRSIFGRRGSFIRHPQEWERGCTNYCSFCSPTRMQRPEIDDGGNKHVRVRAIPDIIAEIEAMKLKPGDQLFSSDLNTSAIPNELLKELFGYLKRKEIKWYAEGTVSPLVADYEKNGFKDSLIGLMSARNGGGGCYSFLYGADDLIARKVAGSLDKKTAEIKKAVEIFRFTGIPLYLSVVIGLDNHEFPGSFFQIARFLEDVQAPYSFIHIATPYSGTPWGDKVNKEGRIIDNEPSHYNHRRAVHEPKNMTAGELQQGYYWLLKTLYTPASIAKTAAVNSAYGGGSKNLLLGALNAGVPWGVETYLTVLELKARGYLDAKIQKQMDYEYKNWKKGT